MVEEKVLLIDLETWSETPIRDGTHRYAENVEILLCAWAYDHPLWGEGPITVEDLTDEEGFGVLHVSEELAWNISEADRIVFHNGGSFDSVVVLHSPDQCPELPLEKCEDTLVRAMTHGLPGGLEKLSEIFKLGKDSKHAGGKDLIRMFCMPQPKGRKVRRHTKLTKPDEWATFIEYAGGDIQSMRALRAKLPNWNYPGKPEGNARAPEYELWQLDQKINRRGFKVDLDLANSAIEMIARLKGIHDNYIDETTFGEVQTAGQRDALLKHLLEWYGVSLPDMTKSTIERRLNDPDLPDIVKELLSVRLDAAMASTSKYAALLRSVSSDGRLRGTLQFCGAVRTGRWAGRLFQPQNLIRPTKAEGKAADEWIEAIKSGIGELVLPNPSRAAAVALRGAIVAKEGHKLVQADLSNIEGRVLAWGAGEQWKLDAFAAYDAGIGDDLYKMGAGRILHKSPWDVTDDERQAYGKVPELACLSPDTQVLTDSGPKRITAVLLTDKLWDGVEWVRHEGLIARGRKRVRKLDGVNMTDDHRVLCAETWLPARMADFFPNFLDRALATGTESLQSLLSISARSEASEALLSSVLAALRRAASRLVISEGAPQPDALLARKPRAGDGEKTGLGTPMSARTTPTDGDCATACPPALTDAITQTLKAMPTTAAEESKCTNSGAQIAPLSSRILSRLKDGISPNLNLIGATTTKDTSQETYVSSESEPTETTFVESAFFKEEYSTWSSVYDIANAGPRNRFTILSDSGALIVHNCGYQGAAGAFGTMAALYGINLTDQEVTGIVEGWREANPAIVKFWAALDEAARSATQNPGHTFSVGDKIAFHRTGEWLLMQLPSGRKLCYCQPAIVPHPKWQGTSLSYLGVNSYTRRWERIHTYGGKWSEQFSQATARDVLAGNLIPIEEAGFPIVLTTHDDVLTEPIDDPRFTTKRLCALLAASPSWAPDLPLAAEGFEAYRNRKG